MPSPSHTQGLHKSHGATSVEDRRKSERFPLCAVAEITDLSSHSNFGVRISDIGREGCYADSINIFPVGTRLRLRIRHAGSVFETEAAVAFSLTGMGMGLNFVQMPAEMDAILMRWLAEANGEAVLPRESPEMEVERSAEPPRKGQDLITRLMKLMTRKGLLSESEYKDLLKGTLHHE